MMETEDSVETKFKQEKETGGRELSGEHCYELLGKGWKRRRKGSEGRRRFRIHCIEWLFRNCAGEA